MNLFNRLLVSLLLLMLAGGAIAIAALAWTIPNDSIDWLRGAVDWLDENDGNTEKALLTIGCGAVALVALAVLVLEVLPRASRDVRVTDVQGGRATLSTSAVAQRIEEAVREVAHVADAKAFVESRRKGVEVEMDLHVDPDANLADVTNQATVASRDVLASRMHIELLGQPRVRLHYRELRLRRQAQTEPPSTSSNTTVVPVREAGAEEPSQEVRRPEATGLGWRAPASPDNTEARPEATGETPPAEKPSKPEPETENKFE